MASDPEPHERIEECVVTHPWDWWTPAAVTTYVYETYRAEDRAQQRKVTIGVTEEDNVRLIRVEGKAREL